MEKAAVNLDQIRKTATFPFRLTWAIVCLPWEFRKFQKSQVAGWLMGKRGLFK